MIQFGHLVSVVPFRLDLFIAAVPFCVDFYFIAVLSLRGGFSILLAVRHSWIAPHRSNSVGMGQCSVLAIDNRKPTLRKADLR